MFRHCHKCKKWALHVEKRSGFSCSYCNNIIRWDEGVVFKMVDKDDDYSGFNIKLQSKHLKESAKKEIKVDINDFHKPRSSL